MDPQENQEPQPQRESTEDREFNRLKRAFFVGLLLGIALGAAAPRACAQPVDKEPSMVLLSVATYHASLKDCDVEWRAQHQSKPKIAIVINQTICEPYQPCKYGTQAYFRTCYRGDLVRSRASARGR